MCNHPNVCVVIPTEEVFVECAVISYCLVNMWLSSSMHFDVNRCHPATESGRQEGEEGEEGEEGGEGGEGREGREGRERREGREGRERREGREGRREGREGRGGRGGGGGRFSTTQRECIQRLRDARIRSTEVISNTTINHNRFYNFNKHTY